MQHGSEFTNDNLIVVGIYYAIFMVVDLPAALIGFLDGEERGLEPLWWLMLQRFGYRQLMYYVVVRSIWDRDSEALRGLGQARTHRHGEGQTGLTLTAARGRCRDRRCDRCGRARRARRLTRAA